MRQDYFDRLQQKKNLCDAAMDRAELAFIEHGRKHNAEECTYLQQAATLQSEMAQMSTGAEKEHHQEKLQQLNRAIEMVRRACEPDYLSRMPAPHKSSAINDSSSKPTKDKIPASPEREQVGTDPSSNNKEAGIETNTEKVKGASSSKREAVSDEDVAKWYKDAPSHSFEDVSGMTELKEQLKNCVEDSKDNELREFMNMKSVHSFFFIGPPGCGKTYIIEAFAHELMQKDYKFISLDASNIRSKFVGDAEKIVKRMFEEAIKSAPCIVFVDEVESVCKNRSIRDLPEYASSITTAFLTGYNQINESNKTIIFIGATNYPGQVDNAMLDRVEKIRVPFPDAGARAAAFERHFKKIVKLDDSLTYDYMADLTATYNYRDIDHLVEAIKMQIYKDVSAEFGKGKEAIAALKNGDYRLKQEVFDDKIAKVLPTPKDDIIRDLDAWEEKFKRDVELDD